MITKIDLENLENQYQIALDHVDKIERVDFYPSYPKEISDFMLVLTQEPWGISYRPSEISNILNNIDQANIDEIREVLTGASRAERFCDGSWENSLKSRMLDPVFKRLREIINI
ncbi:DUF6508 domain-containing protein [Vibrio palustris]|uniref:Uncharacterized protein n=1 Tax=Vibrio palustris TaxID=1918946 RepID=A0A1R4B6H4_9VIBR|nr:DUF6508 domain-containing protein [Vibrio palustris]SJL84524.1 hypothetical protein VPAL9027_02513 [Vibrio palustris]